MTENILKRTWAEISLDAVEHNYREIKKRLRAETKVCCVVKADAYGHGAERLAAEYEKLGADWFAVSNFEEARQLRRAGIKLPILILGYTPPEMAEELARLNISQAMVGGEYAAALSERAVKAGASVKVHISLDTGMSRVGFLYQHPERDGGSLDEIERACALPGIDPEGVFTHFAVADEGENGRDYTRMQAHNFRDAIEKLNRRGISFRIRHCANSAAIFDYPEMQMDMARPGIILYGLMPSGCIRNPAPLIPVMQLKSVVALVKTVPARTSVSYGRKFTSQEEMKVATVPVGYADGYPRSLFQSAELLVRGQRAKIIGRVCMDQLMLDVTRIPDVKAGDTVTVFGTDGAAALPVDELASQAGTINYELVCGVSKRVPRVFLRNGKTIGSLDYLRR
ncbi:alanine racemase [Caproicibacter fermentans]|uniref:Alanine racemase n=1 Tax=Caproicibacter fermentans TaxID=2576756 RepID=A0A7G8T961_9FIRM|nr:alanine racemase [Caproicibacter fermentans]QNK40152.1 alanine racemase [Caproicibacter fermentans]